MVTTKSTSFFKRNDFSTDLQVFVHHLLVIVPILVSPSPHPPPPLLLYQGKRGERDAEEYVSKRSPLFQGYFIDIHHRIHIFSFFMAPALCSHHQPSRKRKEGRWRWWEREREREVIALNKVCVERRSQKVGGGEEEGREMKCSFSFSENFRREYIYYY